MLRRRRYKSQGFWVKVRCRTRMSLRQAKLGKGGRHSSETFRNNPAGNQSRPVALGQRPEASFASGAGNCTGRSVNSESQGRAIEPRKLESRGSLRCGHSGGHADIPQWPGVFGPAGVEEQGIGIFGLSGNLGGPACLPAHHSGSGDRNTNPRPAVGRPGPLGANRQARRRVSPSEGNQARREGHRESHSAIVPSKLGNSPRRTQGREGCCQRADPARGTRGSTLWLHFLSP